MTGNQSQQYLESMHRRTINQLNEKNKITYIQQNKNNNHEK